VKLRRTKKLSQLRVAATRGLLGGQAMMLHAAKTHDEAYWLAAAAGLEYDPDTGWFRHEGTVSARPVRVGVRLEGDHLAVVQLEADLRRAGIVIAERSGPRRGRGGHSLTYLDVSVRVSPAKGAR
jgi:hypothetical protein